MAGPTTASLDDRLDKLTGEVHQIAIGMAALRTEVRLLTGVAKWVAGILISLVLLGIGGIAGAVRWATAIDLRVKQLDDRVGQAISAPERPGRATATDGKLSVPDLRKAIREEIEGAIKAMPKSEP